MLLVRRKLINANKPISLGKASAVRMVYCLGEEHGCWLNLCANLDPEKWSDLHSCG